MPDREPVETKNLDTYGHAPLEWSRVHDLLAARTAGRDTRYFLGTVRPDGRPHAAGIGAVFHDGDVYVVRGPGTQKSRNLEANPACTIWVGFEPLDLILEGTARRVTDPPALERLPAGYRVGGSAGAGGGRGVHRPVQRAERGAPAVAPVPHRLPHGVRRGRHGAVRRDALALRALVAL